MSPKTVELPQVSSICKGYVALSQDPKSCYIGSTYQRGDLTDTPQPDWVKEELFPKSLSFFPLSSILKWRSAAPHFVSLVRALFAHCFKGQREYLGPDGNGLSRIALSCLFWQRASERYARAQSRPFRAG